MVGAKKAPVKPKVLLREEFLAAVAFMLAHQEGSAPGACAAGWFSKMFTFLRGEEGQHQFGKC